MVDDDDLVIDVLQRFVAFLSTLSAAELAAVATIDLGDLTDASEPEVEGHALAAPRVGAVSEASFEYMLGLAGQLNAADHHQQLATMQGHLAALRSSGSARRLRSGPRWSS